MRAVVYIAGPLTQGHQMNNIREALAYYNVLIESGYAPICPHLAFFSQIMEDHDYEEWMDVDFALISKSDVLLRIPGDSPGADREVEFALERGIPVVEVAGRLSHSDLNRIHKAIHG